MAQKIEELEVTKVDFVDRGANPDAHIMLFKRDESGDEGTEQNPPDDVMDNSKHESALKRFITAIGKRLGFETEDINAAVEEIAKGDSASYNEIAAKQDINAISDQMWNMGYALRSSLISILSDSDVSDKSNAMNESLTQFVSAMQDAIGQWTAGKTSVSKAAIETVTEDDVRVLEADRQRIDSLIAKAIPENGNVVDESKGENDMIDTSKMTPAEKLFYEDLKKRYTVEEPVTAAVASASATVVPENTTVPENNTEIAKAAPANEPEDIYAGMHPAVAAELKMLKKRAEDADNRELTEIAKKYEIIGKKPEELVPVLKSLKQAGGSAYTDMITILDASVEAVNKSAMFAEVGKSGSFVTGSENGAWAKIEKKADDIQAQNPKLGRHEAIDMACMQNPDLVHDYESNM